MPNAQLNIKLLPHAEVHKRIIEKPPKGDLLGPFNKPNDLLHEIYNKKRRQFLDACKQYNRLNQETLISKKTTLHEDYLQRLDLSFLEDDLFTEACECVNTDDCKEPETGKLVKKRIEKEAKFVPTEQEIDTSYEPWFKRYFILNKFIWAARTIIIRNRLKKIFKKLNSLTPEAIEEFDKQDNFVYNVSYPEIFEKFM